MVQNALKFCCHYEVASLQLDAQKAATQEPVLLTAMLFCTVFRITLKQKLTFALLELGFVTLCWLDLIAAARGPKQVPRLR